MTKIIVNSDVLSRMTEQQRDAVCYLAGPHSRVVELFPGTFDLPDGYVNFWQTYNTGSKVYGGIDPNGSVST